MGIALADHLARVGRCANHPVALERYAYGSREHFGREEIEIGADDNRNVD